MEKILEINSYLDKMNKIDSVRHTLTEMRESETVTATDAIALDYINTILLIERETARVNYADAALESEEYIKSAVKECLDIFGDALSEVAAIVDEVKRLCYERQKATGNIENAKNKIRRMENDIETPGVKGKCLELIDKIRVDYDIYVYYSYYCTI